MSGDQQGVDDILASVMETTREAMKHHLGEHGDPQEQVDTILNQVAAECSAKAWWPIVFEGVRLAFGIGSAFRLEDILKSTSPAVLEDFVQTYQGFPVPLVLYEWMSHKGYIRGWKVLKEEDFPDGKELLLELGLTTPVSFISTRIKISDEPIDV